MYRLNKLMRSVLITTDEVIYHAPTKQTLDPRTIEHAIIIAEERFIRPTLGTTLYNAIAAAKNTEVTLANQVAIQALVTGTGSNYTVNVGDVINAWETLTADQAALWKTILWKLTAECVMLTAFPEAYIQYTTAGIVHTKPTSGPMSGPGEVTPALSAVKWTMDKKIQDRIEPLTQALKNYLCENKSKFADFDSDTCPGECEDETGIGMSRKTAWITSIYDDEDSN